MQLSFLLKSFRSRILMFVLSRLYIHVDNYAVNKSKFISLHCIQLPGICTVYGCFSALSVPKFNCDIFNSRILYFGTVAWILLR